MHGKKDHIVPFKMGEKLYDLANNPKFFHFSENDDHMMTFDDKLVSTIKDFLIFNSK